MLYNSPHYTYHFYAQVYATLCSHFMATYQLKLFIFVLYLLSQKSDHCAIRARLGVAGHLSTTPRRDNPAKCLSQRHIN